MTTVLDQERKYVNGVFLLGGLISLIFGVLLITRTQGVIEVIMLLLGLWWLIQGLFNILAIFIDNSQWGLKLIGGALGVIAGLLVLNFPLVGGAVYFGVMTIIIGVIGLLIGVVSILVAFQGAGWGAGRQPCPGCGVERRRGAGGKRAEPLRNQRAGAAGVD